MTKPRMYASDNVLEEFYQAYADGDASRVARVHIPLSDVFYVRAKIEADTGVRYSLDRIERAMFLEGMLPKNQVLDPDRKRDWED